MLGQIPAQHVYPGPRIDGVGVVKVDTIPAGKEGGSPRGEALLQTLVGFPAEFIALVEQHQAQKLPLQDMQAL